MAQTLKEFKQILLNKGIRHTRKRDIILEVLFRSGSHLTIDEVLERVKKTDPRIGYVTVYRTLKLLKEAGLAHQWQFGDGYSRFEKATGDHHDHLICMKCSKIIEFEQEEIEALQEEVAKAHQFKIVSHIHEIHGYCSKCQSSP
ncbi:MAG: transcriptional repressor [Deltaproteobacteria bacterium]|nr:transcriptional repressor [Deltaproteobacteria bacterium]